MSNTAIVCLVFVALITGFVAGFIAGRSGPTDDRRGHPYDVDQ